MLFNQSQIQNSSVLQTEPTWALLLPEKAPAVQDSSFQLSQKATCRYDSNMHADSLINSEKHV